MPTILSKLDSGEMDGCWNGLSRYVLMDWKCSKVSNNNSFALVSQRFLTIETLFPWIQIIKTLSVIVLSALAFSLSDKDRSLYLNVRLVVCRCQVDEPVNLVGKRRLVGSLSDRTSTRHGSVKLLGGFGMQHRRRPSPQRVNPCPHSVGTSPSRALRKTPRAWLVLPNFPPGTRGGTRNKNESV